MQSAVSRRRRSRECDADRPEIVGHVLDDVKQMQRVGSASDPIGCLGDVTRRPAVHQLVGESAERLKRRQMARNVGFDRFGFASPRVADGRDLGQQSLAVVVDKAFQAFGAVGNLHLNLYTALRSTRHVTDDRRFHIDVDGVKDLYRVMHFHPLKRG